MLSAFTLLCFLVNKPTLAVVICAPHGGVDTIRGVVERAGKGVAQFTTVTDTRTDKLARDIASQLEKLSGTTPFVVVARVSRKYVDLNREAKAAYEDERAKTSYDAYHAQILDAVEAAKKLSSHALLIDVHGQGKAALKVFRGTQNGETINGLKEPLAFLQQRLEEQGLDVSPASLETTAKENPSFNGGYTVQHYGKLGIAAVQFEFGADYRKPSEIETTARRVAKAVSAYAEKYLSDKLVAKSAHGDNPVGGIFAAR